MLRYEVLKILKSKEVENCSQPQILKWPSALRQTPIIPVQSKKIIKMGKEEQNNTYIEEKNNVIVKTKSKTVAIKKLTF